MGGNIFWPVGDSLSGSCGRGITRVCERGWLPREGLSFWATPTLLTPGGLWLSDRLGLWRLWPQMEASSESLRPPGECMDPLRTELHWGVWQSFLHTVTTIVARIAARQSEIPTTTTMLPPMGATPTRTGGRDGEGAGSTREEWETIVLSILHRGDFFQRWGNVGEKIQNREWKKRETDRYTPPVSRGTVLSP